jgi:hypothetical protein
MESKYKWIIAISSFVAACIGYYIGELNLASLSLNREAGIEINPFDVISVLINSCLALYLATLIASNNEKNRVVKTLMLNEFAKFGDDFEEGMANISKGKLEYSEAVKFFKDITVKHTDIYKKYDLTALSPDLVTKDALFEDLKLIRELITTTGDEIDKLNTVNNNILKIHPVALVQIRKPKERVNLNIFKARLQINS